MTEWTPEKEKKILWRYRFLLTFRILRIILILVLVYSLYTMSLSIGYDKSNYEEKLKAITKLSIDWTVPGLTTNFSSVFAKGGISPFLTKELSMPISRVIGKEGEVVGNINIIKGISHQSIGIDYYQPKMNPSFSFYLPVDPNTDKSLGANQAPNVWETLEKVHTGTVADFAFSTKSYYTPEEILQLLKPYDLDILWMPIYMGEMDSYTEGSWSSGGDSISINTWGLAGAREFDEKYHDYLNIIALNNDEDILRSKNNMLVNMRRLIADDKKLAEFLLGTTHLEERHKYLEDNGFQAYGAIVTGPVNELLKLKELVEIQGVQIGDFTYWNWDEKY